MSERDGKVSIVAIDTGGTFTDVIALRGDRLVRLKLPSSPDDPARAVLDGLRGVLEADGGSGAGEHGIGPETSGLAGDDARATSPEFLLIHGSTVATNALLERRGARVGLVTNRRFEDVLEIGRQNRPQLYALVGRRPPPLVDAADRHGVAGRIGPAGEELEPLDPGELEALSARLAGVEAVAICLLHSYAEPAHERAVADALAGLGLPLSISSALLPEYREYERAATTVVNAYVAPLMDRYLSTIAAQSGAARVRIMGSGGGALPVDRARREAVHTILSGPAGGVMGALDAARRSGIDGIIGFDMGGTSTDVSLCPGRPLHTREFSIAGLPVAVPVLDIHTVGAGGGSLAEVDAGGALRVGPRSAGAVPGPICYGLGGTQVTVTDAHVWLGRLPADAFLGGERRLDRSAVEGPMRTLADRLGTDPDAAAEGVLAVADAAMERALRVISVERGHDPGDFTLVPFGGAGALHAAGLAARLGVPRVLVPLDPGLLSAFGMLVARVRKDAARTVLLAGDAAGDQALDTVFGDLEAEALAAMAEEDIGADAVSLRRIVDARYRGQSFELRVPADGWVDAFHAAHEARYGYAARDVAVEAVTLRVEATSPGPTLRLPTLEPAADTSPRFDAECDVVFDGERIRAARLGRQGLRPGHRMEGPAIVTEYSATTWVPPGWRMEVDPAGGLRLTAE